MQAMVILPSIGPNYMIPCCCWACELEKNLKYIYNFHTSIRIARYTKGSRTVRDSSIYSSPPLHILNRPCMGRIAHIFQRPTSARFYRPEHNRWHLENGSTYVHLHLHPLPLLFFPFTSLAISNDRHRILLRRRRGYPDKEEGEECKHCENNLVL